MAKPTAHDHGHVRFVGKPTSGRYVYRSRNNDGSLLPGWQWQCDLHWHGEALPSEYGYAATMQGALAGALAHAPDCVPYWLDPSVVAAP